MRSAFNNNDLDPDLHHGLRETGAYLCQCPGPRTRDPDCHQQCARCLRRIDRRHDNELTP